MKRIIIVLLVAILAIVPIVVTAQPRYEANFSFSVAVNGKSVTKKSDFIYVYPDDVLDVSLKLKTNEDYYAGPFSTEIFFTEKTLESSNLNWNTNSRFYQCCKTYSNFALQNNNGSYYKVDMIPTSTDCKSAPNALDEALLTMQFTAKGKRDDVAKINLSQNSVRSEQNPFGAMYLACYTQNGDLSGKRYDFGDEIIFDLTQSQLVFRITDAGNMNGDEKISSADALKIIQASAGIAVLSEKEKIIADVDANGKINSADGLATMQIATGLRTINDIING